MFAVGDKSSTDGRDKTELLDVTTWKWAKKASFSFAKKIYSARKLYHIDMFFMFGGWNGRDRLSHIASY